MSAAIAMPSSFESAASMLGSKAKTKIGHNTHLVRKSDKQIDVVYHQTAIVVLFSDGRVLLDHGGWQTSTTKARLRQAMQVMGLGGITQRKGSWYFVFSGGQELPYVNRQTLRVKGSY